MALTDLFVRNVKHSGATAGDKYSDQQGMFLLVKQTHKYWRLSYRFLGKQKALALGVYPAVSLALARKRRQEARDLLVHGTDPSEARRDAKLAAIVAASNTFGVLARQWLEQIESSRTMKTQHKVINWLEHDVFPLIGHKPISSLKPRDFLLVARKIEARDAIDSAHRVLQVCGQVCRFAVASDALERDLTADLRGALKPVPRSNYAALTEPRQVGPLLRAIFGYEGSPAVMAALKLAPLLFVRPGELRTALD